MTVFLSVLVVTILAWTSVAAGLPQNITTLLASHKRFNDMNTLLSTTGVSEEINDLSTATVFVPEPSELLESLVAVKTNDTSMQWLTDICRFHISRHLINFSHLENGTAEVHTLLGGHSFMVEEDKDGDLSIASSSNTQLNKTPSILDTIFFPNLTIYTIDWVMIPYKYVAEFSASRASSVSSWHLWLMTTFLLLLCY